MRTGSGMFALGRTRRSGNTVRYLRRRFLIASGALLVAPLARAQSGRTYRVGIVMIASQSAVKHNEAAFLGGLRDRGYVVGRNLVYDVRYAGGDFSRVPAMVDEIIALKPDVIAGFESVVEVMRAKTSTIPIVLTNSTDPVALGLARSLARPGGNVTGISTQWELFPPKHIQILREMLPRLSRVGMLIDMTMTSARPGEQLARNAAQTIGATLIPYYVTNNAEIERAFGQMEKDRPDALLMQSSGIVFGFRDRIYDWTLRLRIPFAAIVPSMGDEGALLAYGAGFEQAHRDATAYIDKILKGTKPGDLPIEQPTKFELVINLKTAKALRITVPQTVLFRADRVIE